MSWGLSNQTHMLPHKKEMFEKRQSHTLGCKLHKTTTVLNQVVSNSSMHVKGPDMDTLVLTFAQSLESGSK